MDNSKGRKAIYVIVTAFAIVGSMLSTYILWLSLAEEVSNYSLLVLVIAEVVAYFIAIFALKVLWSHFPILEKRDKLKYKRALAPKFPKFFILSNPEDVNWMEKVLTDEIGDDEKTQSSQKGGNKNG